MSHFGTDPNPELGSAYGSRGNKKKDRSKRGISTTSSSSTSSSSRRSLSRRSSLIAPHPYIRLSLSEDDFDLIKADLLVMVQNNRNKDNFFKHSRNSSGFSDTNRIIIEKRDDIYMLVLSDGFGRQKTFLILGDNCDIINILEKIQIVNLDIVFIHDAKFVDRINLFPIGFYTPSLIQEYVNLVLNISDPNRNPQIFETNLGSNKFRRSRNQPPQIDYDQGYQEFIQYDTFLGRLLCIFYFIIHYQLYNRLPKNE